MGPTDILSPGIVDGTRAGHRERLRKPVSHSIRGNPAPDRGGQPEPLVQQIPGSHRSPWRDTPNSRVASFRRSTSERRSPPK